MGSVLVDHPDRRFFMRMFTFGMGRLALRGKKSNEFPTRVDILFQDVKAMSLLQSFNGLIVTVADLVQRERISKETGLYPQQGDQDFEYFVVRSGAFEGYVVADLCLVAEDEGSDHDPTTLWRGPG